VYEHFFLRGGRGFKIVTPSAMLQVQVHPRCKIRLLLGEQSQCALRDVPQERHTGLALSLWIVDPS